MPEGGVTPLGREVVQDQEVADALVLDRRLLVVAVDEHGPAVSVRQQVDEPRDTGLDQIDAGRLERLHESTRQSDGDAVFVPEFLAHAGCELQDARLGEGSAVEVTHQRAVRFVVADVGAGIDMAVADAVLQRYAPLPPGRTRRGARVRGRRPYLLAGNRYGSVAWQPLSPVLVARVQRLLDQKSPEARAVDEQVAADPLVSFQHHGLDEAVGAAQLDIHHAAFGALNTSAFGIAPQIPGIETGVEVIGVSNVIEGRALRHIGCPGHELAAQRGYRMQ